MIKKKYTDEERLELAKKLDNDLDKFIDNLANKQDKKEPKKPFNFNEWYAEIENHPFFLKELNQNECGEYSDGVQALQAMKYNDITDESLETDLIENAEHEKNVGNNHFKLRKYRWAIDAYTKGIKFNCSNKKLNSILYANRAAAQKHIGNTRSAIKDCLIAQKFDPLNQKVVMRAAECFLELGYGQKCVDWLQFSTEKFNITKKCFVEQNKTEELVINTLNTEKLNELKLKAREMILKNERDERKKKREELDEIKKIKTLYNAIKQRNIKFKYPKLPINDKDNEVLLDWYKDLEADLPMCDKILVVNYNEKESNLVWPLLLQYPEISQKNLVTDCDETTSIENLLKCVIMENTNFSIDNIRVFIALATYDGSEELREINLNQCLKDILSQKHVEIMNSVVVLEIYTRAHLEKYIEVTGRKGVKFTKKKF